nr:GNAT family N-acetyltransferase [Micromonospora sp. DSM 115978]
MEPAIETGRTAADWDGVADLLNVVFHDVRDDDARELNRVLYEPARSLLVRDDTGVVAHAGAFTRDLTVPGAVLPAAHVTQVGVAPTHRRQGLLSLLMRRQLEDIRRAGEPIAALWASESAIYPRFGYGMAAQRLTMEIDTAAIGPPTVDAGAGRLRMAAAAPRHETLASLYDRLRPDRPGWSSRDTRWWRRVLDDPPTHRDGATVRQVVVHESSTGTDGYALWRSKAQWEGWRPCGKVRVEEIAAETPEAYARIWQFLLTIDLTRTVHCHSATLDEPLQHLVADPRALNARVADGLWVRIVDVGTALTARRYATSVDVVLDVTDPLLAENTGRWRLTGDGASASCVRTTEAADLACDVRDLGAVYLGGPSLAALATAGRVRELRPGAVATVSPAFGWRRAPASIEVF